MLRTGDSNWHKCENMWEPLINLLHSPGIKFCQHRRKHLGVASDSDIRLVIPLPSMVAVFRFKRKNFKLLPLPFYSQTGGFREFYPLPGGSPLHCMAAAHILQCAVGLWWLLSLGWCWAGGVPASLGDFRSWTTCNVVPDIHFSLSQAGLGMAVSGLRPDFTQGIGRCV